MHFALISVVTLTIGTQAAPQYNELGSQLGDLLQGTRSRLQNTLSGVLGQLQRTNYQHQMDGMLRQSYWPDNNQFQQINQANQALWNQWSNLLPMNSQSNWLHRNPINTNGGYPTGSFDINNFNQRPIGGSNGGWEMQHPHGPPQQQPSQDRPRRPPPPHHGPGHMSLPPPPPPPFSQNHHHHRPGPPPQRPQHHQPNRDESGPVNSEQNRPTVSVAQPHLLETSTIVPTTAETSIRDDVNPTMETKGVFENSISSTTEFDWNNFYVGASPDNTGGAGTIDIRTL